MEQKLTNKLIDKEPHGQLLANLKDPKFILSFKYKLENGYTFKEMKENDLKVFQSFLNKVSQITISQVDKEFLRPPDKQDVFRNHQIQHYAVSKKFRIHGILENQRFKVIRLDPGHNKHK